MPVPVARYALVVLLGLAAVMLVILLVRPFVLSFADARDDANYALAAASTVDRSPLMTDVLLEQGHGLAGESSEDDRVRILVAAAALPGSAGYSVVNAWSPTNDCELALGTDRLVDCEGDAWTYAGFPIDPEQAMLQAFPNEVRQGAIIVDFTNPLDR